MKAIEEMNARIDAEVARFMALPVEGKIAELERDVANWEARIQHRQKDVDALAFGGAVRHGVARLADDDAVYGELIDAISDAAQIRRDRLREAQQGKANAEASLARFREQLAVKQAVAS